MKTDQRAHFTSMVKEGKKVVVSTIGDPIQKFSDWLRLAVDYHADVIVAACRPESSTEKEIQKVAKDNGYEIIWFKNFRFENRNLCGRIPYNIVKDAEANGIVEVIKWLL